MCKRKGAGFPVLSVFSRLVAMPSCFGGRAFLFVNQYLSDFADIIVARAGVPYRERGVSVISVIVDGTDG